jgi:branched-chain amino acid transport system substrate-binding protein
MAVYEINKAGGVMGRNLQIVSHDDGPNLGDTVRAAEELVTGEAENILFGTFLSNVGLAVTEFADKKKVFFLVAEPLSPATTTFRRPSTLLPDALAVKQKRWAHVYKPARG